MYSNVAYLHNSISVVKDLSKPLMVTSCGYYRINSGPAIKTNRPRGRGDYQLLYIAEGKAHFFFDGVEKIVQKGEAVLFRPYQPQSYFYYNKDQCEVYWVHFTGGEVEEILAHYGFQKNDKVVFAGTSPDYPWLFEQLIRELQLCREHYEELLVMLLRHILLIINRYSAENGRAGMEFINEIEKAVRYFNQNYNTDISIEEYAESLHTSTCWFIRRFKQVVKMTPMQYIVSLRVANAKTLLETKGMNVAEVSCAVGYDNPLYFSRIFSKYTGMSPTEYKKKCFEE